MSQTTRLGDLQLAIMRILWDRGEATVADVHDALHDDRGLALTTIATMLRKMEHKGVVDHREDGRTFVYRPTVHHAEVSRTMVGELTDRLFGGDATALVNHLINEKQLDAADLERIRSMIDAAGHAAHHRHRGGDA